MRKPAAKPRSLRFGDVLKVERRYVVDGIVTCVTDKGKYGGVEVIGSIEHIVVDTKEGRRMIPLSSVSEIHLVTAAKGEAPAPPQDPAYL